MSLRRAEVDAQVVIPERGTALRRARVLRRSDGGYTWLRRLGPAAPEPFMVPSAALRAALGQCRTVAGSGFAVMQLCEDDAWFQLPGPWSASEELITGRRPATPALLPYLEEVGRLLRRLHDLPANLLPTAAPPALRRLESWLHAAATPPSRRQAVIRTVIERGIGEHRWAALSDWLQTLRQGRHVPVHGWCGLGHVVLAGEPPAVQVTVGEDIGLAPAALDVGFILGQFLELDQFLPVASDRSVWNSARAALLRGYGDVDFEVAGRCAALGIMLHVHDFATYFDVRDAELPDWVELLVRAVDGAWAT